jgi:hypothetical protein
MTNFRIPKKLTRKTTPSYPLIIHQPHHHATMRYNIPGGAVDDDDDDIFVGESVSAQELVSRARAKGVVKVGDFGLSCESSTSTDITNNNESYEDVVAVKHPSSREAENTVGIGTRAYAL